MGFRNNRYNLGWVFLIYFSVFSLLVIDQGTNIAQGGILSPKNEQPQKLQTLKTAYKEFDKSLKELTDGLRNLAERRIDQNNINLKDPCDKIQRLETEIENLRSALYNQVQKDAYNKISIQRLKDALCLLSDGINTKSLYNIQNKLEINTAVSQEQQLNDIANKLDEYNIHLRDNLYNLNQILDPYEYFIKIFFWALSIFLLMFIILLIIRILIGGKKNINPIQKIEQDLNILEEIEQPSQKNSGLLPQDLSSELKINLHERMSDLEPIIKQILEEEIEKMKEIISKNKLPESTISHPNPREDFIPEYDTFVSNYNNNSLNEKEMTPVSETTESIQGRNPDPSVVILEKNISGNYWLVQKNAIIYLVPKKLVIFNEYSYGTLQKLFICYDYNQESSEKRFFLLKPAIVFSQGGEWKLKEMGVLQFE